MTNPSSRDDASAGRRKRRGLWCRLGLHRWALSDDAKTEMCLDCGYVGPVPEELRSFARECKAKERARELEVHGPRGGRP